MTQRAPAPTADTHRGVGLFAVIVLILFVYGCSIYVNLSFAVRNSADYRFFPPFRRHLNANNNRDLAAENFNIARSLVAGKGFARPFPDSTGPTAWMPPALPSVLAGLLRSCSGERDPVMAVVVFVQINVLIGTGLLVLFLARQTTRRLGTAAALALFIVGLLCHFWLCFQLTQDCWIVLLAVDLLLAGACWLHPLERRQAAVTWGLFGGLCALVNPVVGATWGGLLLTAIIRQRCWSRLALALLAAALALTPWTVRNYLVLGRWIPVKSNLAYELYQSQCLQSGGLVHRSTFQKHPYNPGSEEGRQYRQLGEIAYLERKRAEFLRALAANPADFAMRVASRLLSATLWYEPFEIDEKTKRPWVFWLSRLAHPLPFLGLLVLVLTARRQPLVEAQAIGIAIYVLYLLPYIGISYYDRYAVPLLAVKVLLVIWGADRVLCWQGSSRRHGVQGLKNFLSSR